jgi:hypothetical protein
MIGRAAPLKGTHERRTHRRERRGVEPTFDRSDEVFAVLPYPRRFTVGKWNHS